MPARKAPPVAAVVVGVLIAAAIVFVVLNRAANRPPEADAQAVPTPKGAVVRALDLEASGQRREAADILRKRLDERPDDFGALSFLRRLLPDGNKDELGDRLARGTRPEELFDHLAEEARGAGDDAALAGLNAWLKKARPNDYRWACDEIKSKIRTEQYAAATAQFRDRLAVAPTDFGRARLLLTFVEGMCGRDRHLDAYATVPDGYAVFAFRTTAQSLETLILNGPPGVPPPDASRRTLRALIDAHRGRAPADPRLWYDEGVLLQAGREYERAEKVYADGQAKWPRPPSPDPGPLDPPYGDDDLYRARRVECLYRAGLAMKAYADIGPPGETFHQLADAFVADQNPDGLTELLAAQRARFPQDKLDVYGEAQVQFLRGEYAKAAAGFEASGAGAGIWPVPPGRGAELHIRSLLRVGDTAAARRVGPDRIADTVPAPLRVAFLMALGELDRAGGLLADAKGRGGLAAFYADEDFAREIAAPKFAELRAKYPDPRKK